jgi:hypothetical protein
MQPFALADDLRLCGRRSRDGRGIWAGLLIWPAGRSGLAESQKGDMVTSRSSKEARRLQVMTAAARHPIIAAKIGVSQRDANAFVERERVKSFVAEKYSGSLPADVPLQAVATELGVSKRAVRDAVGRRSAEVKQFGAWPDQKWSKGAEANLHDVVEELRSIKREVENLSSIDSKLDSIGRSLESLPSDIGSKLSNLLFWIVASIFGGLLLGWISDKLFGL